MKKNWINPEMLDLSVENTEAQLIPNGDHDGVIYTTTDPRWPRIEGHS